MEYYKRSQGLGFAEPEFVLHGMAARLAPEWVLTIAGIRSHEAAGENLAGLYALVATCEANQVNPEAYLADVMLRVQSHPNSRIRELLPHEWKRRCAADPPDSALQPSL